jgi:hypothetical protein
LNIPEADFLIGGRYIKPLVPKVWSILNHHSIKESRTVLRTKMVSKPGYPGGEEEVLTLVIHIDQASGVTTSWSRARDELLDMFGAHGLTGMHIEMYDPIRAFMPWLLPLSPNDPTLRHYETKRAKLLEVVKNLLGKNWVAMSVFGLGSKIGKVRSCLVVLVQPRVLQDWNYVTRAMRSVLKDSNIPIEFIPGGSTEMSGIDLETRLTRQPQMGSSIGEVGEIGSGTLGGHVILRKDGVSHVGFLTNHHVVRPYSASANMIQEVDRYGYGFTASPFTTGIQYPSKDDHQVSKAGLEELFSNTKDAIKDVEGVLERYEMKGQDAPLKQVARLETYQDTMRVLQERKTLIDQLPIKLGNVLYSSGQALGPQKNILDWAFVKLANSKAYPIGNQLPGATSMGLNGKLSSYYGLGGPPYMITENPPKYARFFAGIEKGEWYFKIGRTTNITTGLCHGTEVEVSCQGQIRWDPQGNQVIMGTKSTSELVIMGRSRPGYDGNKDLMVPETFSKGGDTGSFVFNCNGEVAGLLYGRFSGFVGPETGCMNAGLVTSMDIVLASIKEKTGGELSLPVQGPPPAPEAEGGKGKGRS